MYLCQLQPEQPVADGADISTGFVVDDAIVMIENIARYVEQGEPPFQAALKGAKQIGFTIVSLTVSLVAVLDSAALHGRHHRSLFREFAVTLSIAIGVSAVLSLTLTAMMCAFLLRPHQQPRGLARLFERGFSGMMSVYQHSLGWLMRHQFTTLVVTVATLGLTIALALVVPKGFFPQQDTGLIVGVTEAPADVSFASMMVRQRAAG